MLVSRSILPNSSKPSDLMSIFVENNMNFTVTTANYLFQLTYQLISYYSIQRNTLLGLKSPFGLKFLNGNF